MKHNKSNKVIMVVDNYSQESLPHPWFVTEDAHVNIPGVLAHFHKFTQAGDYVVVEDTHPMLNNHLGFGLFKEVEYAPTGTKWIYDPFKEFMKVHGSYYRVDAGYTDLYG
ncbi:hypothetical protein QZH41_013281 [Actinostola sp. cb2023]|nr:hypothetical protein QZH41_013281 [Actinostola sp. cb2023]